MYFDPEYLILKPKSLKKISITIKYKKIEEMSSYRMRQGFPHVNCRQ